MRTAPEPEIKKAALPCGGSGLSSKVESAGAADTSRPPTQLFYGQRLIFVKEYFPIGGKLPGHFDILRPHTPGAQRPHPRGRVRGARIIYLLRRRANGRELVRAIE